MAYDILSARVGEIFAAWRHLTQTPSDLTKLAAVRHMIAALVEGGFVTVH
jgi:hypothetical protein